MKHRGYNPHVQACHSTNDETWKRCHWVKSKLPFRELFRNTNFCIQIMWQKSSTFLAIVTPSYTIGLPKRSFIFFLNPYNLLAVYDLILVYCIIARMSSFSGQCERLSMRLVYFREKKRAIRVYSRSGII